ncbi:MAG: hypothetical protein HN732_06735, partial [Rhodospirillaceae bacterium]|nr:hypothetical protein [Rhodospirillaceae bacterium]
MMHRIRLAPKLALVLLVFATTIVVVLGLLSFNSGRKALHQAAVAHLVSNAAEKKAE